MYGLWTTTTTTGEGSRIHTDYNRNRTQYIPVDGGGEIINCFGFAESGGFGGVKRAAV